MVIKYLYIFDFPRETKIKKRFLCLAMSMFIMVLFMALSTHVYAASSVTCGDNLTWMLDNSGTLTINCI